MRRRLRRSVFDKRLKMRSEGVKRKRSVYGLRKSVVGKKRCSD